MSPTSESLLQKYNSKVPHYHETARQKFFISFLRFSTITASRLLSPERRCVRFNWALIWLKYIVWFWGRFLWATFSFLLFSFSSRISPNKIPWRHGRGAHMFLCDVSRFFYWFTFKLHGILTSKAHTACYETGSDLISVFTALVCFEHA